MTTGARTHVWLAGGPAAARAAARAAVVGSDRAGVSAGCHRRRRGPYTGTGSILRAVVPDAWRAAPDLVAGHRIEILCAAPELATVIGAAPGTLTELSAGDERTRWYSRTRTGRVAHGLVEFLRAAAALRPDGTLTLFLDELDAADPTDQEFVAVALRRLDPARVLMVLGSTAEPADELSAALRAHARRVPVGPGPVADAPDPATDAVADTELAGAYVAADGTDDDPALSAAYRRLDPRTRAELHQARAAELLAAGELTLRLGAIPYHLLRGTDPAGAGVPAARAAMQHCLEAGYYDAVLDLSGPAGEVVDEYDSELAEHRYPLLMWRSLALTMLGRPDDAERVLLDLMTRTQDPRAHLNITYQLGMLYTRHLGAGRKDHPLAKAYLNNSIALSSQLPDADERNFHLVFMGNGLALVEMHLGRLDRSYELVTDGLARLDRELPADRHLLHRSVLVHNRAQVLAGLGRAGEALADFDRVIDADPYHPEYYFDRGNLRARTGDPAGAVADYERAMGVSPPFPELFYNRGDARLALGDRDGAVADFRYVLDLEPAHPEARISLAELLLDGGDPAGAVAEAERGLAEIRALPPDPAAQAAPGGEPGAAGRPARLLCLLGQAALDAGDPDQARAALDAALAADGTLHQALVARATLAFGQDRFDDAVGDLDQALALAGPDPDVLFNRGYAQEAAGRPAAAAADYQRALQLPGADRTELLAGRDRCLAAANATVR